MSSEEKFTKFVILSAFVKLFSFFEGVRYTFYIIERHPGSVSAVNWNDQSLGERQPHCPLLSGVGHVEVCQ